MLFCHPDKQGTRQSFFEGWRVGGGGMWEMGSNFKRIYMRNRLNLSVTWEDFPGNKVRFRGNFGKDRRIYENKES